MANPDLPNGFRPTSPVTSPTRYKVDSSNTPAFFIGDVVDLESDGNANVAAAASTAIIGSTEDVLAVSTAGDILVYDDPQQRFLAQDDAAATPTQTMLGNNADHVAGTGSATTLLSAHEVGLGSVASSSGQGFRLLSMPDNPGYALGNNMLWKCMVNEHLFHTAIAGV